MKSAVLITGADGYLGSRLVRSFLNETDRQVVGWVRALTPADLAEKLERVKALVGRDLPADRFELRGGDLRGDSPFASIDPEEVDLILHSASVVRFNVEEDIARTVNYEGSLKLFRFASACPSLSRLVYLSTAYASGLRSGEIPEAELDNTAGFANHYESSKWKSEQALRHEFSHLPWVIARIATVIADDDGGKVTQYNAVHNTLKLIYYGLISLVPGDASTPLYFVTGKFITNALKDLATKPVALKEVYNLVHRRGETLTVGQLIDSVYEVFQQDPGFAARRVLKPLLVDEASFGILADQMKSFSGGVVQQAMGSIEPFAKQLFVSKDFRNERTIGAIDGYRAPDPLTLARETAKSLVATKWGRK